VQADEELRLPRRERPDAVDVPDLLKKRVSHADEYNATPNGVGYG